MELKGLIGLELLLPAGGEEPGKTSIRGVMLQVEPPAATRGVTLLVIFAELLKVLADMGDPLMLALVVFELSDKFELILPPDNIVLALSSISLSLSLSLF